MFLMVVTAAPSLKTQYGELLTIKSSVGCKELFDVVHLKSEGERSSRGRPFSHVRISREVYH